MSPAPPAYVVARLHLGPKPCAVEGGFGSVWVSMYDASREVRIDPKTDRVIARIRTDTAPCGIAVGGGSVWVENFRGDTVTRIDPATNKVVATIKVGSSPYDVTWSSGAAWVTNYTDGTVSRIDGRTDKVRTIRVQESPTGIAPAGGAIWVSNQADETVSRIDPRSLKVRSTKLGFAPSWASWGSGGVWFSDTNGIDRVDLSTGRRADRVRTKGQANDGDIVGRTLWVTDSSGRLYEISRKDDRLLGSWPTGLGNPFVLVGYRGLLWTVDFQGTDVEAIDPAKLRH